MMTFEDEIIRRDEQEDNAPGDLQVGYFDTKDIIQDGIAGEGKDEQDQHGYDDRDIKSLLPLPARYVFRGQQKYGDIANGIHYSK